MLMIITIFVFGCQEKTENIFSDLKYPDTGQRIIINSKLDSNSIATLNSKELRLLRNEIFARRGYIFKSNDLQDYFCKYKWYKPEVSSEQIDKKLFETDKLNIQLIQSIENSPKIIDNEFGKYIKKIKDLNLPFQAGCDVGIEMTSLSVFLDNELINIRPNQYYIYAKKEFQKFVMVIYGKPGDSNLPVLYTYKYNGDVISTLNLFDTDCGGDALLEKSINSEIDTNLVISIVIRKTEYTLDSTDSPIDSLTKSSRKESLYKIEDNGLVEKK